MAKTSIIAGRDISLETRDVSSAFDYTHNSSNYYRGANSTEVGTQIQTQGDLTLSAGARSFRACSKCHQWWRAGDKCWA
ncbi:Uncharacterised protein [Providencia stuartii]|nr:Uncharacterised protein [Providencia stuartii]